MPRDGGRRWLCYDAAMPYYGQITGTDDGVEDSWLIELDGEGVPGSWRDCWDDRDDRDDRDDLEARAEATERRQMRRAEVLGLA